MLKIRNACDVICYEMWPKSATWLRIAIIEGEIFEKIIFELIVVWHRFEFKTWRKCEIFIGFDCKKKFKAFMIFRFMSIIWLSQPHTISSYISFKRHISIFGTYHFTYRFTINWCGYSHIKTFCFASARTPNMFGVCLSFHKICYVTYLVG